MRINYKKYPWIPHVHKFDEATLSRIERDYSGGHYNNSLFDNSTWHARSAVRAHCYVCCEPGYTVFAEYTWSLPASQERSKKVIEQWKQEHSVGQPTVWEQSEKIVNGIFGERT